MGSAFHQLCPRYSGTLTPTAPTAIRLWETFTFFSIYLLYMQIEKTDQTMLMHRLIRAFPVSHALRNIANHLLMALCLFPFFIILKQKLLLPALRTRILLTSLTLVHSESTTFTSTKKKYTADIFNPIAFGKAKIVYNFGLSECNRVNGQTEKK